MNAFTHLHVHTQYSLLDGAAKIDDLVNKAVENGQKALAITDHGNMYGVVDFYKACLKAGIKPIIGMETYVAPRARTDRQGKMDREYAHLILLAKNQQGYHNLCELSTQAFTEGFYYRPRIDYDLLFEKGDGLIVMSACLAGDLPRLLLNGNYDEAKAYVSRMKERFGEDFYIEIQDHGIEEQRRILPDLLRLCQECGVKPVATNDVHYVRKEDAAAQDALMCIQMQRYLDETDRMKMSGSEFYLKDNEEMERLFSYCPEAIAATGEIADKCHVDFEFGMLHLPNFEVPDGYDDHFSYLRMLCERGLARKCADKWEEYRHRLESELAMIEKMGYTDYFLIVWDFIDYARSKGIAVGPGRGSAAGSLAAYCLDITDVDPIRYGLIFERFLNPERISMPDIDVDFCYERRQEVIDYVVEKYGVDRVSQIITFGTMGAKQAIRDVGRVMRMPYGDVDRLAKMVPFELGMTLEKALRVSKELRLAYESDERAHELIDLALKIEGMPRHASTHAAGVVISAKPLVEYLPLQTNDDVVTTQFPMGTIEELGLLKMDFLGLRTLTVIQDTLAEIERGGETAPDFSGSDYDDPAVYKLLSCADTAGVFQLESGGMRSFMTQLRPDSFEDIIAGISLYRPGPMDQIPTYVERKFHPEKIQYLEPRLEPILKPTYGVIVYQEQVMQIVRDLAGYSMGRSDLLRRAMSKKKKDVMEKERAAFVEGCAKNGISEQISKTIYDQMMDFAQYAFNKSHAAAYAVLAYQTAYLKAHWPAEFMSALLNSFLSDSSKVSEYINDCRSHDIALLPPSVNASTPGFHVERNGKTNKKAVRYGMAAIKNVGLAACRSIVKEREQGGPFASFADFVERCAEYVSKRSLQYMIQAGALDGFGPSRAAMVEISATALDRANEERKKRATGQFSLFDAAENMETGMQIEFPNLAEFRQEQKLTLEKEATGLYISGHPLEEHRKEWQDISSSHDLLVAGEAGERDDGEEMLMGGIVTGLKRMLTRKNEQMAFLSVEDLFGGFECVVFPRVLDRYRTLLVGDALLVLRGKINTKEEDDNVLILEEVWSMDAEGMAAAKRSMQLYQKSDGKKRGKASTQPGLYLRCEAKQLDEIVRKIGAEGEGDTPVVFALNGKAYRDRRLQSCQVNEMLLTHLEKVLGTENVKLVR